MPEHKSPAPHGSSSEAVTNNVRVEVESQYAPERSQPFQSHWFFHYTVRISNEGDGTVQLLSRHWIITDGTGKVEEVRGPGVIGEQPVLEPGETFRYASGCPLTTPSGMMQGSYRMVTDEGASFDVEIPAFSLDSPMSHPTLN